MRFVSVGTCCLNEVREKLPAFFEGDGGGGHGCHRCCLMLLESYYDVGWARCLNSAGGGGCCWMRVLLG